MNSENESENESIKTTHKKGNIRESFKKFPTSSVRNIFRYCPFQNNVYITLNTAYCIQLKIYCGTLLQRIIYLLFYYAKKLQLEL